MAAPNLQTQTTRTHSASSSAASGDFRCCSIKTRTLESVDRCWRAPKGARNGLWQPAGHRFEHL
eukprot:13171297-Alexandrium_andersonii.AAC.1